VIEIRDDCRYLTQAEMAARLRISIPTLRRLSEKGEAPQPIKIGRKVLYPVRSE
jgi:predicted DNA-binding transcriptional regulator AlpA